MNSLSWLLYFAELADNVDTVTSVMWGFSLFGLIVFLIFSGLWFASDCDFNDNAGKTFLKQVKGAAKIVIPVFCVLTVITVLMPSSTTIYAIAASEYGEQALKTPEFSKARQALNVWLDKQLKPQ